MVSNFAGLLVTLKLRFEEYSFNFPEMHLPSFREAFIIFLARILTTFEYVNPFSLMLNAGVACCCHKTEMF